MRRILILSLLAVSACSGSRNKPATIERPETVRIVTGTGIGKSISTATTDMPAVLTVKAPIDAVWQALPRVYAAIPIPIEHLDHTKLLLGNPNLKLRGKLGKVPLSRYLDCGSTQGGPSADSYEIQLSVLTQAQPADSASTIVSTAVQGLARPINFTGDYMRCATTAGLETHIGKLLMQELAK